MDYDLTFKVATHYLPEEQAVFRVYREHANSSLAF